MILQVTSIYENLNKAFLLSTLISHLILQQKKDKDKHLIKNEPWEQFAICATLHFIRGKIYILQMSTMFDCRRQVQGWVSADSDCKGLTPPTHLVQPPTHPPSGGLSWTLLLLSCQIPQPTDMSVRETSKATVNGSGNCSSAGSRAGLQLTSQPPLTGLQQMTPSVKIKGTHGHYYWSKMDTQHKLYQPPLSLAPTL